MSNVEIKQKENYRLYCAGDVRGYKIKYGDKIGYTIGQVWKRENSEEEDVGLCYDFSEDQYDDTIKVLAAMSDQPADEAVPDPDYEEFERKRKAKEKTLWWKIKDRLEDFSLSFNPFYWRFHRLFITRPVGSDPKEDGKKELMYKMCRGIHLGPFTITW